MYRLLSGRRSLVTTSAHSRSEGAAGLRLLFSPGTSSPEAIRSGKYGWQHYRLKKQSQSPAHRWGRLSNISVSCPVSFVSGSRGATLMPGVCVFLPCLELCCFGERCLDAGKKMLYPGRLHLVLCVLKVSTFRHEVCLLEGVPTPSYDFMYLILSS